MSTPVIELPFRGARFWVDRARALFNGAGYAVAVCVALTCWWTVSAALPDVLAGHWRAAAHDGGLAAQGGLIEWIPWPILTPLVVNLAPRASAQRILWWLIAALPMCLWCGYVGGYSWSGRPALGNGFGGLLITWLVVGVCAYHSYSRDAGDELARYRIGRAERDTELRRIQLQLLRAQIEPHFLFNTLSAVRALARFDRIATVEMLDNLIRYFEAALPREREDEVPLAREMQLVDAYLSIYQVRMGKRLAYELEFEPGLETTPIPTMILLTLVENALKHGVGPSVEGGHIRVSAGRNASQLLMTVADSGRGLNVRLGHGIGLANIRQRLLLLYGEDAILSLRPAQPRGVVASVILPLAMS